MNPILLKPNSDCGSQVVVNGKVWRNMSAREYYTHFPFLMEKVLDAYEQLALRYEFIVIEGAGSITELNLKQTDLVNLGLAKRVQAPVLLTADIDHGGVFASVVGTFALLDSEERDLVRSFSVNRFRGDPALFDSGVRILEERTGKPCLGVFPYLRDTVLDAEDSVTDVARQGGSDVAIIAFPRISNVTDFCLLPQAERITAPVDRSFATVILPGTKNTLGDLLWLRTTGLADWVLQQRRAGAHIVGICGGYQMLCERIEDPLALESKLGSAEGLGLLPGTTVLESEKVTRRVCARTPSGISFEAYEIHLGSTTTTANTKPFATLDNGMPDGIRANGVTGTYLHGALENAEVLSELIGRTIRPLPCRDQTYDALADWFDRSVNQTLFEELYL